MLVVETWILEFIRKVLQCSMLEIVGLEMAFDVFSRTREASICFIKLLIYGFIQKRN